MLVSLLGVLWTLGHCKRVTVFGAIRNSCLPTHFNFEGVYPVAEKWRGQYRNREKLQHELTGLFDTREQAVTAYTAATGVEPIVFSNDCADREADPNDDHDFDQEHEILRLFATRDMLTIKGWEPQADAGGTGGYSIMPEASQTILLQMKQLIAELKPRYTCPCACVEMPMEQRVWRCPEEIKAGSLGQAAAVLLPLLTAITCRGWLTRRRRAGAGA